MQLFQYSGFFEEKAQQLRRDALQLQTAALCGVASTGFLDLMEGFYGVDESPEERALGDTSSFAEFVSKFRKEKDKEQASVSLSKAKSEVEDEESKRESDDSDEDAEVEAQKPLTLKQKRKSVKKYPSHCSIMEATLFYPTSSKTVHETGVDSKYIGARENLPQYRGLYCCLYGNCDYGAQVRGATLSHIRRVHLGHALAYKYCPEKSWWQARYWLTHMSEEHPGLPMFEIVNLPPNLEAVKVEPDVFVTEEHFEVPVPKRDDTPKPPAKKPRVSSSMMSYSDWEQASKEGELFLLADSPNPDQPRPQVAAIRYRYAPAESTTGDKEGDKVPTYSVASDGQAAAVMSLHEGEEFESTEKYQIEG